MFTRHPNNPLISPAAVRPSRPGFEVIGAFNAGATLYQGEILLLLRVAERPVNPSSDTILIPHLDSAGAVVVKSVRRDDPAYDTRDSRLVGEKASGVVWLTSLSHLRLARSNDGVHFTVEERPWLQGEPPYEAFGVEDARITQIGARYYVNYTAVSPIGIATALVSTEDFTRIERHGVIFPPSNRDVTLFPEQVGGQYLCYHRPMPGMFARLNIWMAASPDLVHWGDHHLVLESSDGKGRVGGGAPPIKTDAGWLSIYHAADANNRYVLSAFLTALDAPGRIVAHSRAPILVPEAPYEVTGFFGNVVFTCGTVLQGETLMVYYGAADERIALATCSLSELVKSLEAV
jgi:predicted GH43/DUF377 family glycosyl hydrolase